MYFGNLILGFLARGDLGEGGGVVTLWMMCDGVICTVFGDLGSKMAVGTIFCGVCVSSGGVSFYGVVGCRRGGVAVWSLVVVVV